MMLAIGIVAVLVVMYVLLCPKESEHVYEEYCTAECIDARRHNNRVHCLQYR